jgi:hypothetical protein
MNRESNKENENAKKELSKKGKPNL